MTTNRTGIKVVTVIDNKLSYINNESLQFYATCFRRHFEKYKECAIGIAMKKSPGFVAAVMELLKQEIPFVYLHFDPLKYAWTMAKRFCVSGIISDCKIEGSALFEEIQIFDETFYFYNMDLIQLSAIFDTRGLTFAYGIQTSGTTGEPKTVYVPKRCIDSNIKDMKDTFLNGNNRAVFWGTHPSFDPSLLELLLSIEAGATLIIPPTDWGNSIAVPTCLNELNIDFLQTTPTKLMMMPKERLQWIFEKNSPVKNLFIGGEIFPVAFLNQIIIPETAVKIYNIYGVTEVSCWATFSSSPIKFPRSNLETCIGKNMSDTVVEVEEDGKVFIKSKFRECVVNFEWNGENHFTGDYGYEKDGDIFISGRATQKIKGLKPSNEIQQFILSKYSSNFNVINVLKSETPSALVIVVLQNERNELNVIEETVKKDIFESFPSQLQPSRIIAVYNDQLRTTQNGKIDIDSIIFEKLSNRSSLELLKDFQIDISLPTETPLSTLGLDSLQYLELATIIQPILAKIFPSPLDFLNHIRAPNFTIGDISRFVFLNIGETHTDECENVFIEEAEVCNSEQKTFKAAACVEVPVVQLGDVKKFYVFGSFAGDVYTMKPDGTILDKKYLGSPIEVPAINFWNLCGFIASSNGRICKIKNTGKIAQFLKIPGEIRCPIFYDKEYIYIITVEKYLWRIHHSSSQADTVFINTSCRGIPLIYNERIYIPGLKEFVIVDQKSLLILNHLSLSSPIFTNAFLWKNFIIGICAPGEIIVANQDNKIYSSGYGPPVSETPLILKSKNENYDIWCCGGYFQSIFFTKVYCKNLKIIIEPFKRLIFPKNTGIVNIPFKVEANLWAVSCHRCHIFFFGEKQLYSILETSSNKTFKVISSVLQPENSSLVQPMYYSLSESQKAIFFSTRNDSVILLEISKLINDRFKNSL